MVVHESGMRKPRDGVQRSQGVTAIPPAALDVMLDEEEEEAEEEEEEEEVIESLNESPREKHH